MQSLREFFADNNELLYDAMELATCGYYVRPLIASVAGRSGAVRSDSATTVMLSRQCMQALGHPIVPDDQAAEFWRSLYHPNDIARVEDVIRRAVDDVIDSANSPSVHLDYRLRRVDGSYRYTRETGRVMRTNKLDEAAGSDKDSRPGEAFWIGVLADIDQQVAYERKLVSQNYEIQTILDTIPTYIWVKDNQSRFLKVNRAAAVASGLEIDQIEGRLTSEVYPQMAQRYQMSDEQLMHDALVQDNPEILVSADGTRRRMRIDKYKLQSEADPEPRILIVGTDVSEIEGTQLALRKSEAQFRAVFDASPIGMLLVDGDGIILLSNDEADKMFAYENDGLTGNSIEALVPAARRPKHAQMRSHFIKEPGDGRRMGYGREFTAVRSDGTTLTVEVSLTNIQISDKRVTLASVFDVTERAETATKLKLAVEVGNVGFWEFDLTDQSVELSPQALMQLGLTEPWTDLEGFKEKAHPEDIQNVLDKVDQHVRGDIPLFEAIFRLLHADGTYRWFLSRGSKITDDDGTPVRLVGFHIDITQQQKLKLELERSNHDLDRFAYIASHDLKAPLRGIQHVSQWIEEDLGDDINDQIKEHLSLLSSQSSRMNLLLDDLLAYARVGRQTQESEIVDLNEIVQQLFDFMTPPAHLRLRIEGELPTFRTNRPSLEQVIRNLIGNAIQHAGADNPEIRVSCTREDSFYLCCIQDFGEGIPPEYHKKVFEMFRSLKRRDRTSGSGMGLALVQRLCEHAGGRAWVESEVGKGAKFYFTWPELNDEA